MSNKMDTLTTLEAELNHQLDKITLIISTLQDRKTFINTSPTLIDESNWLETIAPAKCKELDFAITELQQHIKSLHKELDSIEDLMEETLSGYGNIYDRLSQD